MLKVSTSALVVEGEKWAVYTVENRRARRMILGLGHLTGQAADIASGQSEGVPVVSPLGRHPHRRRARQ